MENIGFIGLGKMGVPILKNIQSKYGVKGVYNRTRDKALQFSKEGIRIFDFPGHVAANCSVIFTMLTDSEAVEQVVLGEEGLINYINRGSIIVDLSTISPSKSLEIANRVREKGAYFLDAPVIGSITVAEGGELTIVVGGEKEAYERIERILQTFGKSIHYMGKNGSGLKMKLVNNLVMGGNLAVLSESLVFGEVLGIPREKQIEIMSSGAADSRIMNLKKDSLISETFEPMFLLKHELKDLNYALEMARKESIPIPLGSIITQFYTSSAKIGYGNLDFSSVLKAFKGMLGRM